MTKRSCEEKGLLSGSAASNHSKHMVNLSRPQHGTIVNTDLEAMHIELSQEVLEQCAYRQTTT